MSDRVEVMRSMREAGRTLKAIGESFDISRERVRQLLDKAEPQYASPSRERAAENARWYHVTRRALPEWKELQEHKRLFDPAWPSRDPKEEAYWRKRTELEHRLRERMRALVAERAAIAASHRG